MDIRRFALWRRSPELEPYIAPAVEEAGFTRLWIGTSPGSLASAEEALASAQEVA